MTTNAMTTADVPSRTTLRAAAFGDEPDAVLTDRMTPLVPARGLASGQLTGRRAVSRTALRLIDSRILATSLRFLDQPPCPLLLSGLTRFQALTRAARDTLSAPGRQVVVSLVEPYRVTSRHRPEVAVILDGNEIAHVPFDLVVTFAMCETSLAVRRGAIEAVDCAAGALTVSLALADGERLLHRTAKFPVRQEVRPPMRIPLPEGRTCRSAPRS
ncbi:hypothetical protein RHCRD62_40252 [Rhodococcus sp. RD6.2]|uniref:hypothetical protein n=1 Tax=Rhodococcus sp. RD6.2 TaxID=260936 RepID=UPI00063B85AF|nr:hypothetical protein [Rhodococcus sp. RD6.2]CRK52365.1 hypothetical protein RHCRD62_40252 [Rhodococcus sp. RD6.2]